MIPRINRLWGRIFTCQIMLYYPFFTAWKLCYNSTNFMLFQNSVTKIMFLWLLEDAKLISIVFFREPRSRPVVMIDGEFWRRLKKYLSLCNSAMMWESCLFACCKTTVPPLSFSGIIKNGMATISRCTWVKEWADLSRRFRKLLKRNNFTSRVCGCRVREFSRLVFSDTQKLAWTQCVS